MTSYHQPASVVILIKSNQFPFQHPAQGTHAPTVTTGSPLPENDYPCWSHTLPLLSQVSNPDQPPPLPVYKHPIIISVTGVSVSNRFGYFQPLFMASNQLSLDLGSRY